MLKPVVSRLQDFIRGCMLRSSRRGIVIYRPLEESGTFHLDPAGRLATGFDVGVPAREPGSATGSLRRRTG